MLLPADAGVGAGAPRAGAIASSSGARVRVLCVAGLKPMRGTDTHGGLHRGRDGNVKIDFSTSWAQQHGRKAVPHGPCSLEVVLRQAAPETAGRAGGLAARQIRDKRHADVSCKKLNTVVPSTTAPGELEGCNQIWPLGLPTSTCLAVGCAGRRQSRRALQVLPPPPVPHEAARRRHPPPPPPAACAAAAAKRSSAGDGAGTGRVKRAGTARSSCRQRQRAHPPRSVFLVSHCAPSQ